LHHALVSTRFYRRLQNRDRVHAYWRDPMDGTNRPEGYLLKEGRSRLLVDLVRKHAPPDPTVLEIGCNVGRNLQFLHEAGYRRLSAIEISEKAVQLMREAYPEMSRQATVHNQPVEEVIRTFPDGAFDVVFTMAVLEHIHTASEWIFAEMMRISKRLVITIEDERSLSWKHFARDYGRVFQALGMEQVESARCDDVEGLGENFFARAFVRRGPGAAGAAGES